MKSYVVISAVGKDQPGFVNRVAHSIGEEGGNIELQRSVRMAGEYAALFLVSLDDPIGIHARLAGLQEQGITLTVRDAVAGEEQRPAGARAYELIASGADQPGIIDAVTRVLFQLEVNIESMNYDTESAPFSGDPLFRMIAAISVPPDVDPETVRQELNLLEDTLNVDLLLRPLAS